METENTINATADTRHEAESTHSATKPANHLAGETSPYLLQHAHNPVDWHPWGDEALQRAEAENKPIFLSIGYSSCHWCHVMERESFEDPQTAALLNEHFVAIKVDREERPDLDEIYMTAVQLLTGRGGWPLSVFLTPELKPFYGGTYFPPDERFGMPSFRRVLQTLADAWREKPDQVADSAEQMVRAIEANAAPEPSAAGRPDASVHASVFDGAVAELRAQFDPQWGGFGPEPKFPSGAGIGVLLRRHLHAGDADALAMATVTLDRMARGGIHDQIGGGFHRYSVDAQWLVPHFEEMLYDNAILAGAYLEAWQATGNDRYRRVAAGIFDYVLRDMTDPRGGFHSAEDADSEGEEGNFYVWRSDEIRAALGDDDAALFAECYGVSERGNFEGRNILHLARDPADFAREKGLAEQELEERLAPLRRKLLAERARRVRPGKDDKVLAAWNGMMIVALARGYQVLGEKRYLDAAKRAADFVLDEMVRDGTLRRTYRATDPAGTAGVSKLPGYLDDYAEMTAGLVDLYEASFELRWLEAADALVRKMTADFWDEADGGFFYTSADHKDLLVRTKPFFHGAVPSGNATATLVLARLSKLLDDREYAAKADAVLASMAEPMQRQPRAHLDLLVAADFHLGPVREIAIAGPADGERTRSLLEIIHTRFLPNKILALAPPDAAAAEQAARRVPLVEGKTMRSGETTVYVCEGFTCKRPVTDATELKQLLEGH